jgi:hypothetical protein
MTATATQPRDLWSIVLDSVQIDPEGLLYAIQQQIAQPVLDARTRALLRDSYAALQNHWGGAILDARLSRHAVDRIHTIQKEDLGDRGFPSLEKRLMLPTRPKTILQFLEELGQRVNQPCRMTVGGSCGLILKDLLQRRTDDIDAVNEVPEVLRTQHELLDNLTTRYGLRLAHFQSHYLPDGWEGRIQSLDVFGQLQVFLVDPLDILVGKLFSRREKDLDDLRIIEPLVGQAALADRLKLAGKGLRSDETFLANAARNWMILFRQPLPE